MLSAQVSASSEAGASHASGKLHWNGVNSLLENTAEVPVRLLTRVKAKAYSGSIVYSCCCSRVVNYGLEIH